MFLLISQAVGNTVLLSICLICFAVIVCSSAAKEMVLPVFLFFLPFSVLLKFQPDTISVYTLGLVLVYLICFFKNGRKIPLALFLLGSALLVFTFAVKIVYGYGITNDYIMFFSSMLFIPFIIKELNKYYDFYWLTLFFSLGIIIAAITSQFMVVFPSINRFISVIDMVGIIRRSGYYGDPNFYAMHITAALGGVLILILNSTSKLKTFILSLITILLLYCGFLSVSKSFVLVFSCMVVLWFIGLLLKQGRMSFKFMTVLVLTVGIVFLMFSTVFTDNIADLIERFTGAHSLDDLTTGRLEIWEKYLQAFEDDPLLLLFGKGYTKAFIGVKSTHNTILQCIFQFGILGSVIWFIWVILFVNFILSKIKFKWGTFPQFCMLLIGVFGPWLAIDLMFFDELFLFPIYACVGTYYLNSEKQVEEISKLNSLK